MPAAIQIPRPPIYTIPSGTLRMTEFARAFKVPWVFLGDGTVLDARAGRKRLLVGAGGPKVRQVDNRLAVGFGTTYGTSTSDRLYGINLPSAGSGWRSMFVSVMANAWGGGNFGRLFQATGNDGLGFESMYMSGNSSYPWLYNRSTSGSGQWGMQNSDPAFGRWATVQFTHNQTDGGFSPAWVADGVATTNTDRQATLAGTSYLVHDNPIDFGNRSTTSDRGFDGYMHLIIPMDGDIEAKNHQAMGRDFGIHALGMVVEEEPIWVYYGAGGGGGGVVWDVAITEAVSAGDGATTQLTAVAGVTEGVTAGDGSTTTLLATATIVESVTASDSVGATMVMGAGISEGVTAGDGGGGPLVLTVAISEGVTAADSPDASLAGGPATHNVAIIESVSAGDSVSATMVASAGVSEGVSPGDGATSAQTMNAGVSEGVTAGDGVSSTMVIAAVIAEAVNAGDTQIAIASMMAAITESVVAGDGAQATMNMIAAIAEGVNAGDGISVSGGAGPSTTDLIYKILTNRQELNPTTGKFTIYADDGVAVLYQANAWEDAAGTVPYRGGALQRIDRLA